MRASSAIPLLLAWCAGLFLALWALASGSPGAEFGFWTAEGWTTPDEVEAAELPAPPEAAALPARTHVLSRPLPLSGGPFRPDPSRRGEFLRRLLLPERARSSTAEGTALRDRRLLDYLLETEQRLEAWETQRVDAESVS